MCARLIETLTTAWQDVVHLSPTNKDARITIDGHSLTISQLVAIARYGATPQLSIDRDPAQRAKIEASVACLNEKLEAGEALYGINTGFGMYWHLQRGRRMRESDFFVLPLSTSRWVSRLPHQ